MRPPGEKKCCRCDLFGALELSRAKGGVVGMKPDGQMRIFDPGPENLGNAGAPGFRSSLSLEFLFYEPSECG